ncbi:MAG TPA: amino acid adenylation domain-containing protein, partial [Steroidobacter sp.]|uniref:non-ribosomal peptide synthetase n=1 Tax=Steroidobacter sp. TaxID=1978227 RepID=UPI002EDAF155
SETAGMLLFNVHHIASDGRSGDILVEEFITQYEAIRTGRADPLPPLTIRYADYAQWQRNWLTGAVLERQLGYWERQLLDLPPVHSLPLSRPRPAQASFKGARHPFHIDAAAHQALKRLAQERQATLFMVLHAAVSILLSRHSNSTDIVIGTPLANRMQKELEDIIGFFVNTLVLRADCAGNPRFTDYLERIKAVNLEAQSNQDVPFEYLVERLKPERSTQYSPLFQIAFTLEHGGEQGGTVKLPHVQFSPVTSAQPDTRYELVFDAREMADGIAFHIDYNTDLFESASIVRMAQHLGILLDGIVADPQTPIHALPLLSEQEQHYLLHTLNATQAAYPQEKCIHELFEAQVEKTPNNTALVYEHEQLTYRELNERANRLAHYLRAERHVQPDELVGICIDHSTEMLVAILGILKAGGAYAPLDPKYPRARLAYMLEDAKLATVLTRQDVLANTPIADEQAVCLDDAEIRECVDARLATNIEPRQIGLRSHHMAYVLYTSGSTGNPKGVMIEHASVVNLALSTQRRCGLVSEDGVLLFSTINSDPSVANIFSALGSGCRLVLRSEAWLQSTEQFWERCASAEVTILDLPTAYWHELAKDSRLVPARSVRRIHIGGEKVNPAMVAEWHNKVSQRITLSNVYGPTETTVDATFAELSASVSHIGRPIENAGLYVLNGAAALAPLGVPGELHIGGAGLARGYLNRPDLTAERFVPNPFYDPQGSSNSKRLYKTGDLVRYLPDGNLEYIGRVDDQVKIRGFRVELGEIESRLAQNENVAAAVVLACEDAGGENRLVAYITATDSHREVRDLVAQVRGDLEATLPEYMVPSLIVPIDSIPTMPNGKVDKKALAAFQTSPPDIDYVGPRTETERMLVAIWAELLHLQPREIGTRANFFDLGGHSLLLIRLSSRIGDQFGVQLTARKLFDLTDIVQIGHFIDSVLELRRIDQHFQSLPTQGVTEVEILN